MATRRKRQTNVLHDTTTGTVNISPSSNPAPQNTGFFDRSFTNTGSSKRRKRRRRLHAQARQQAAQARAAAEAQAQAEQQARAQAHAQAQAAEQARAQAAAQAQREQAYRQTINDLTQTQQVVKSDLALRYEQTTQELPATLLDEIQTDLAPLTGNPTSQQLADLILQEKSRINYLLAGKQAELEQRNLKTLTHGEALSASTPEQYRHYLESRSQGDPQRAQETHQAWTDAVNNEHEARLLAESAAFLEQRSTELSEHHARVSQARQNTAPSPRAGAERLWSAITPSSTSSPSEALEKAGQIAKEIFIKTAINRLKLNPGVALALYSPTLGDAERTATIVASPVSQLNLPPDVDMEYVASVKGSIDVPQRLVMEDDGQQSVAKWVAADGVKVGTKVRVRHFTYNAQNNTYEFIRDGDTRPALVWTPIEQPADSSTRFPGQKPVLPVDPGVDVSPQGTRVDELPSFVNDDPDDYILVFPPGSGLPDTYLLFKDPRTIPGVATGYGKPVTGTWLGESTRAQGAPIPSQIADQLRDRQFSSFGRLREEIWKAIASDPELQKQFNPYNLELMKSGRAPQPKQADQVGRRKTFEIHHQHEIANGGAVYDIDNLRVLPPKQHIEHHRRLQ
ncbi:S-type pyocin domain-containing protein [Pseudomonas capsici]|uniref:S-type pyocin domain-containing protein n=1 Tax=Pseudomonas capsici TaxID=2810614 RepID=A0ABT3BWG8_9PSED|nr:S-type pyocin domain-containing protein [Pseudomonas capsici]MBN6714845.1 S-type pyocin domain-containing protein [Pseudomonas capsici]MBN6719916.1 S-type pyocin domain-containing protein [Pseudomonas capsici]MBN6724366.1 S-type pyocin domain-containing protein [Pseudomonas capsici]MCV4270127.1 S-type pyocin domain-containing protein [Pseudomonas capsici]MCV4278042.1 S-type pyocin domain-containing protein [Pseudomonas capsici]